MRWIHGHTKHTWLHGEAPDLNERADLALRRRVQHDDAGADDAQGAAQHSEDVEPLVEHQVRQDGAEACHETEPSKPRGELANPQLRPLSARQERTSDHLTMMLRAPSGVTRIAGAKAYAAKFAISPTTIVSSPDHHSGCRRYEKPPLPARHTLLHRVERKQ